MCDWSLDRVRERDEDKTQREMNLKKMLRAWCEKKPPGSAQTSHGRAFERAVTPQNL